ncbi:unnamed protein product [Paramecium octaurelia]|uniref:Uncharacterized protein n=1 Tax=Paramecium octaurelia TaxID=43137 RepID=A0A8S1UE96_PAROT|nr:unnamed protein product [Paramecium octaurelia]
MATLFQCDGANCIEAFLEVAVSTTTSIMAINGFRIIFRDRNKLLSKLNKIIYGISMSQLILLSAYFIFWGSDFVISTIRCLRILNEILLCSLLAEIGFEKDFLDKLEIVLKVLSGFVFIEWFWTAIISNEEYDYYCLKMDLVYLSGTTVILTLLASGFGFYALDQLQISKQELKPDDQNKMNEQALEIKIFLGCDLLSGLIQFGWDYWANMSAYTIADCKSYYEASSITSIFVIFIMKVLTLMISPMAIYYILYYKQRQQFNYRAANVLDINVLIDRRSELVVELTNA